MGVRGAGLRSDGLMKQHMNGSHEDQNSASAATRTGGTSGVAGNTRGLAKGVGAGRGQPGNPVAVSKRKP